MSAEEATINPDGTTTFATGEEAPMGGDESFGTGEESTGGPFSEGQEEEILNVAKGTDPAFFIAFAFIAFVVIYYFLHTRNKKKQEEREAFFFEMDGDKFNIKLPDAVEEFYEVKDKCIKAGWEPGKARINPKEAANSPATVLAQALMKRCISDIPLVTHIQKESALMNKLYSQSMCSIKQWKSYQAAESLVSQEVEEVRAEADEIEPGWSQSIWRQAMQYHQMLKNRNEMEAKQREEATRKKALEEEEKKKPKLTPEEIKKQKELAAEKAAKELLEDEEKEKKQKSFKGGMKKGFLVPGKT